MTWDCYISNDCVTGNAQEVKGQAEDPKGKVCKFWLKGHLNRLDVAVLCRRPYHHNKHKVKAQIREEEQDKKER